jgi:hypothetical protein
MKYNKRLICLSAWGLIHDGKSKSEAFKFAWDLAKKGIYIKDPNIDEETYYKENLKEDQFDFITDEIESLPDLMKQADDYCINAERYEIVDDNEEKIGFFNECNAFCAELTKQQQIEKKALRENRVKLNNSAIKFGFGSYEELQQHVANGGRISDKKR